MATAGRKLEDLHFDNLSLRVLPVDANTSNTPRQVPGACFSRVQPTPVSKPELVAASLDALALLDIDPNEVQRPDFAEYFAGNKLLPGAEPAAHCYCGHQFGYFSGQLGDGATMYLGEVVNARGERWELQFKGAGKTPYSRTADGRKVLRSSIREFLCSEAMFNLGIPTTRGGTCVTSGTRVVRDIKYDGNAIMERATVITRIAPTFLRFGSFEIFKPMDNITGRQGPSSGKEAAWMLPTLLHHVIRTYYPHTWAEHDGDVIAAGVGGSEESHQEPEGEVKQRLQRMYQDWLAEVVRRTASLVAAWQCVGWCHGVLNTDNMSIVGVTIDYGPFGFLDRYDPDFVCNGSDDQGRYDYKSQPDMCKWNCERLAEAIRQVLPENLGKRVVSEHFDVEYARTYNSLMRRKLGLLRAEREDGEDELLAVQLLKVMEDTGADFNNVFRALSRFPVPAAGVAPADVVDAGGVLDYILTQVSSPTAMAAAAGSRIPPSNLQMLVMLAQKNPDLLHQLGMSQQMLQAEVARMKRSQELSSISPEAKSGQDRDKWASWLASYGERLQHDAASGADPAERADVMNSTNPRFILRNWIAQQAIERAEKGDFSEVRRVLELLRNPYSDAPLEQLFGDSTAVSTAGAEDAAAAAGGADRGLAPAAAAAPAAGNTAVPTGISCGVSYDGRPPAWAEKLCVT